MPRKKPTKPDAELIPDEVEIDAKPVNKGPARKVVETKTITYEQPVDETDEIPIEDEYEFDNAPKQRKKKTEKELRSALRDRLGKSGVLPTSQLRVHVFKFEHENDPTSGVTAEKSFCTKFFTDENGITNGQHLDIAQKYGPGRYLFMVYMNNAIVTSFEERVSAPSFGQPVIQNGQPMVSMPDPQNPNVIVQMPAQQAQPVADPYKDLERSIKLIKSLKELDGPNAGHSEPQTQKSENEMLISALANNPKVVETALDGIFKFGKRNGGGEDDVSWASVVKELITSEHGPLVVREFVGGVFNGFKGMFSGGNNGTAQMASQTFQDHQSQVSAPESIGQGEGVFSNSFQSEGAFTAQGPEVSQNGQPQISGQATRPEDELLAGILDHCKRKMPPKLAADRAMKYAEYIEQIAPHQSIFTILESFVDSPVADSLALLAMTSEEAAEIIKLPHAEGWAMQLQAELKKAYEPGGENAG